MRAARTLARLAVDAALILILFSLAAFASEK